MRGRRQLAVSLENDSFAPTNHRTRYPSNFQRTSPRSVEAPPRLACLSKTWSIAFTRSHRPSELCREGPLDMHVHLRPFQLTRRPWSVNAQTGRHRPFDEVFRREKPFASNCDVNGLSPSGSGVATLPSCIPSLWSATPDTVSRRA